MIFVHIYLRNNCKIKEKYYVNELKKKILNTFDKLNIKKYKNSSLLRM